MLTWLRTQLKEKGLNTGAVAAKTGLERQRVRKVLGGAEPMLVDELLKLTELLELSPAELGAAGLGLEQSTPDLSEAAAEAEKNDQVLLDGWGNQPEQLVKAGFALGCDFMIAFDVALLEGSGVPAATLQQYAGANLPIRLDAAYHQYNEPEFTEEGFSVLVSFDQLYRCTFSWESVKQVMFWPYAPEVDSEPPEPPEEEEPPKKRPSFLRLVD